MLITSLKLAYYYFITCLLPLYENAITTKINKNAISGHQLIIKNE